jgi:RNA ligase
MSFAELLDGLRQAKDERLVYERPGPDGLVLYTYSEKCMYDGMWTPVTMAARGLIVDTVASRIAATPFPKFFNAGERGEPIPDIPFETMEKLDGSLIIIFHHQGRWKAATKGAFDSMQSRWAQERLNALDLAALQQGTTYLAEAIYPENRIVVRYEEAALVMLAAYDEGGTEIPYDQVCAIAERLGWRAARRYAFQSVSDLLAHAQLLPRTEEGFVLRFTNGHRLKVKGSEYKRIHALISRITPLAMWELMLAGDDIEAVRRDVPEEFWGDFDAIRTLLDASLASLLERVKATATEVAHLSDKDVGLRLNEFHHEIRGFIFPYRKSGGDLMSGRNRQSIFRSLRPTSNVLPGYVASYAINRVLDDDN